MDMKQGYYITEDGTKLDFGLKKNVTYQVIDVSHKNIIELNLPEGIERVYCLDNKLKELVLPKGVEEISCPNNQLKELVLPDQIKKTKIK